MYIYLNKKLLSASCSDTIDPDYARYLATLDQAGFEEQFGVLNADGTVTKGKIGEQIDKFKWKIIVKESTLQPNTILVRFRIIG